MIKKYFLTTTKKKFIFWSFFIPLFYTLLLSVFTSFILKEQINKYSSALEDLPIIIKLIVFSVIAPFIETFIFQFIIIEFLLSFIKKNKYLVILLSGFLFGFAHYFNMYNLIYSIAAMVAGIIFATIYIIAKDRKDIYFPFLLVFGVHAFINLTSEIINFYLK